jgi:hypothetical protein
MNTPVDLVYIIDRSGSMFGLMYDAVGGFNTYVEEQKKIPGTAYLTLVAFDDKYDVIHDRILLQDVPVLTFKEVQPRGMTALLDAVGKTIQRFQPHWRVTFNIMTDGLENASREYLSASLKQLIEERTAGGWEFNFVGAGIDNFAEAQAIGIKATNIHQVAASAEGVRSYTGSFNIASTNYRINN